MSRTDHSETIGILRAVIARLDGLDDPAISPVDRRLALEAVTSSLKYASELVSFAWDDCEDLVYGPEGGTE